MFSVLLLAGENEAAKVRFQMLKYHHLECSTTNRNQITSDLLKHVSSKEDDTLMISDVVGGSQEHHARKKRTAGICRIIRRILWSWKLLWSGGGPLEIILGSKVASICAHVRVSVLYKSL